MPETPDDFQQRVGQWAEKVFPHASTLSVLSHLADEVIELCGPEIVEAALGRYSLGPQSDQHKPAEEAADIVLILKHFAYREGFSLFEAEAVKFSVCQGRTWGPPDDRGVSRHVEAGALAGEGGA